MTPLPEGFDPSELLTLRVTSVRDEAERVRSFELRNPDDAELPAFDAGAHLQVEVQLPNRQPGFRAYSLLGDPRDRGRYAIAVQLEVEGRGGSRFMHDRIVSGSSLRIIAPRNGFPLLEADHSVLIAGGIGITPILSMVRTLEQQGRSYELHYAARTQARMPFRELIMALARERARLYFTDEKHSELDVARVLATARPGSRAYVCGPREMILAAASAAQGEGWPGSGLHFESFGENSHASEHEIEVYLERSALTVHVARGETVLDAILDAGGWVPYSCRRGECASCMTRVIAGELDHRDICLTPTLRETHMCPCVSRARSNRLVLDL